MLVRALGILLLVCGAVRGDSAAANQYNQANRLYAAGDFQAAREQYLAVVATGVEDARLYYNLGNACFKTGELGEAILWYERARRLDPRDPDIRNNLRFANAVKQDRDPEAGSLVWQAVERAFAYPTLNELCVVFSALLVLLFSLGVVRLRRTGPATAGWTALLALCATLLLADTVLLTARVYYRSTVREAIVTAPEGTARSGPGRDQTAVFVVHEGTKLRLERQQSEWLLSRLANGLGGWLHQDVLEEI